ncbi:MAG: cysteine-rich CWC family protein [Rubrivivax sp.]
MTVALRPITAPICPLCGNPNECAASASGSFEGDCWCKGVAFTQELLAQVPPELKDKACICRRCAGGGHANHSSQGQA